MNILVLGGTGAMGSPLVDILASCGNEVFVTSRKQRSTEKTGIHYITGNAHELDFLTEILRENYDAIIDFMVYSPEDFRGRIGLFLKSTKQYFFFSSSRVYADAGNEMITEDSPRLLDVTQDKEYLETDEYALAKAREENILRQSGKNNWTIIRPYITYNNARLQLGVLEKESWLWRALEGKAIVFGKDIASQYTTLTYGYDVALRVVELIGKKEALGETFHITTEESVLWQDILGIYLDVLEKKTGRKPKVCWVNDSTQFLKAVDNRYQIKYDRLFNRKFNNAKIDQFTEIMDYQKIEEGLRKCLSQFLVQSGEFMEINWRLEGAFDKVSGDKTRLKNIPGWKNRLRYIAFRYFIK
ncbi:MAG TPA: epimerase [Candidatus Merdisoma merdipullorum]|nr:epimerase [Candidatus Merdisoma merdipullorum]